VSILTTTTGTHRGRRRIDRSSGLSSELFDDNSTMRELWQAALCLQATFLGVAEIAEFNQSPRRWIALASYYIRSHGMLAPVQYLAASLAGLQAITPRALRTLVNSIEDLSPQCTRMSG
jgi:hypothetical protein